MEDDLITIARFNHIHDAYLIRSKLESEGIECFIPDEMLAKTTFTSLGVEGGIRLKVRERDAAEALEILNEEPTETFTDGEES
jgi:hypothetical protein